MQEQAIQTLEQYRVVINHEEQYSLLPSYIDNPAGWRDAGFAGERQACLDYIGTHWTDMRPLSLRRHMEAQDGQPAKPAKGAARNTTKTSTAKTPAKPRSPAKTTTASKTASKKPATRLK